MSKSLKRFLAAFIFFLIFSVFNRSVYAQGYTVENFESQINVKEDTSLLVNEKIEVVFDTHKHGILRIIPVRYTHKGKTFNSRLKIISVKDEEGNDFRYEKSNFGQGVEIKIGDPDKTISGKHVYNIAYTVRDILQNYDGSWELYWNVTGSKWDTDILKVKAQVVSEYAKIIDSTCYAGLFGSNTKNCDTYEEGSAVYYRSNTRLGPGKDLTIAAAFSKDNQFVLPSTFERTLYLIIDNWGYLFSFLPFSVMFYFWLKKGRDKKYLGDNVYYDPEDKTIVDKPLFAREHLPMVYSPIQGYSPAQIGTIIDEKVDIHDVVAEITELARLKFIKIEKIERKKLIGKENDFSFTRLSKAEKDLEEYQKYLLDKLFDPKFTDKSLKEAEKYFKGKKKDLDKISTLIAEDKYVLLSAMKEGFYKHLSSFREKLYGSLDERNIFDGKPNKIKEKWIGLSVLYYMIAFGVIIKFADATGNFIPLAPLFVLVIPTVLLAVSMPRRKALGYQIYRQTQGLAFYLKKGKWREEVNEKNLFFAEMLPLAISLEVVNKLAKDMEGLGIKPPDYFAGTTAGSLSHDLTSFRNTASNTLVSAPGGRSSGSGSWSGGSGFSGGSSGGGFGGGGGGSW